MDEVKKNKAVALKYEARYDHAPKVIAKGRGKLAEKIINLTDLSMSTFFMCDSFG